MIAVGVIDRKQQVDGHLKGNFFCEGAGVLSGPFFARADSAEVVLLDEAYREVVRAPLVRLRAGRGSTFQLGRVTIGISFHWQREEDQTFEGDLVLVARADGTLTAINMVRLEAYLASVISSEMSAAAPLEFLKAHAVMSRSWLIFQLVSKDKKADPVAPQRCAVTLDGETVRWYGREEHDIFDVCADDHCQRYQGITKIVSRQAQDAVFKTSGTVLTFENEVCDARYYKACGGITESFPTAWEDIDVPYLRSITDAPCNRQPVTTEEAAAQWILSCPEAYCNTADEELLAAILPGFDQETKDFFRWHVEYRREDLEKILRQKSGLDFGTLAAIVPLQRGPSGRICRLKIMGSQREMIVGKELEIRRWLSPTHLYSSAFFVETAEGSDGNVEKFVFRGAGWGHGVGLCQIGAAVMASKGFSAGEILRHYFPGTELKRLYRQAG